MSGRRITKLLVANRGEIACRVMRACRDMGIATVAVFSEPDRDATFVAGADESVALGGSTATDSYLRADVVIAAARATGADAIHPGYGFLSESAGFARACEDAGITFVGPSADVIEAMGSKIGAKALMRDAGVPVLEDLVVGGEFDAAALAVRVAAIGWPVLVKASAGGGGRGMRLIESADELEDGIAGARREAQAAFGDDTLFLERFVERSRHVEIQIFGDMHGNVTALFERECSVQRRHQKVVEESPSPALDPDLRARMSDAGVAAGRALAYIGAGTVEFLLGPDGAFHFLEVNTRLQVEHPVTELITGLDLVRLQLEVAQGAPLPVEALAPRSAGHAIEVRLYSEDPARSFLPQTGAIERFRIPESAGVRVDTGVEDGSEVTQFYDPMLAKVIAHASTRSEAAARLARALRLAEIHGPVTNRDFLVGLLEHPEFLSGDADTGFLIRHDPGVIGASPLDASAEWLHAAAAALANQADRRAHARGLAGAPSGYRNNPSQMQSVIFDGAHGEHTIRYRLRRDELLLASGESEALEARLHSCTATSVDLEVDGVRRAYRVNRAAGRCWVNSTSGQASLKERPRFPDPAPPHARGSLTSPTPGVVVRVMTEAGATVRRGAALVVIEAMKMEHVIAAPSDGTVAELQVTLGEQVEAGAVLAVLRPT